MKLNFITDQGSTRATVRCACRAERFDAAFFWALRDAAGASPEAAFPGLTAASGVLEAAWLFAVVPARRNDRAGEDGEFGGGSGMSQANAAGETIGASELDGAVLAGAVLEETVLEETVLEETVLEAGVGDGSTSGDCSATSLLPAAARVASVPAPSALPGVAVSVEPAGSNTSFTPLATASPAGASPVAAAPRALRSGPLPLAGTAGTGSAWAAFFGVRRGAAAMMPAGWVSCPLPSSRSSSPPTREVTMVGEAPPDPSGLFVRLSKPSSL
jgi:hypothetical protein